MTESAMNQRTIGVVIEKGPNARDNATVPNKPANRRLLKSIFCALGKPVPKSTAKRPETPQDQRNALNSYPSMDKSG